MSISERSSIFMLPSLPVLSYKAQLQVKASVTQALLRW